MKTVSTIRMTRSNKGRYRSGHVLAQHSPEANSAFLTGHWSNFVMLLRALCDAASSQASERRMTVWRLHDELGRIRKETVVSLIEILLRRLPWGKFIIEDHFTFTDVATCILGKVYRRSSKTSVKFYWIIRRHIPHDSTLHSYQHEKIKSKKTRYLVTQKFTIRHILTTARTQDKMMRILSSISARRSKNAPRFHLRRHMNPAPTGCRPPDYHRL